MAVYDVTVFAGDTWLQKFTMNYGSSPMNLSSALISIFVKKGKTILLQLTNSDGVTISGNDINVQKDVSIPAGTYGWSLRCTIGSVIRTYIIGKFTVKDS